MPHVALQSLSAIILSSCAVINGGNRKLNWTRRTAKSSKSIHLFATCTRMAVAFAIIVLSKQLKKFLRVNATGLSFCCKWIHAPSRLICIALLDQPFHFGRFGRRFSNNKIKKGNLLFGNTVETKDSSDRVFEAVQTTRCTTCFKDWLHRLSVTDDFSTSYWSRWDGYQGNDVMVGQIVFHTLITRAIFGDTLKEVDITNCRCYCRLRFLLSFKEWGTSFL